MTLVVRDILLIHVGSERPKNMEKPKTKRFREELRSVNCRLEIPTAVIIPVNKQLEHENTIVGLLTI